MKYDIEVNPLNPVEYLACCGVFEILARFDVEATSWWELEPRPRFWIQSQIDEPSLLQCLTDSLSNGGEWETSAQKRGDDFTSASEFAEDNATDEQVEEDEATDLAEGEGNEGFWLGLSFHLNDQVTALTLDWWYETLTTQRRIKAKSAWKMYAGQQTAEKISRDMVTKAAQLLKETPIGRITDLIRLSTGMTGRFGFDPRSSRNALDTGYSPNDLKLPIATFPFAELLTTIAAQQFFPQRTQQAKGITSSRGWIGNDAFRYALWRPPLPIMLARMAAIGAGINNVELIPFRAERANRDKYSNFRMATMTTLTPRKDRSKH